MAHPHRSIALLQSSLVMCGCYNGFATRREISPKRSPTANLNGVSVPASFLRVGKYQDLRARPAISRRREAEAVDHDGFCSDDDNEKIFVFQGNTAHTQQSSITLTSGEGRSNAGGLHEATGDVPSSDRFS